MKLGLVKTLLVISGLLTLASCGGGGGGNSSPTTNTNTSTSEITYQSVATAGELVAYTVDIQRMTYAYRIVQSAYDKQGATGSGQLTMNADGTYTPSGIAGGKIAILSTGLILGSIKEDLNNDGTPETLPVVGIHMPITSMADAAGVYNFVSRQCLSTCENYYGTVRVNTDGTWNTCVEADLASTNPSCQGSLSGSYDNFLSGRATITASDGVAGGSMLLFKDPVSGQKVIVIDLNGASSLGKGAVYGASQSLPVNLDGTWNYTDSHGGSGTVMVTGTRVTSPLSPDFVTFTRDRPWAGFLQTTSGNVVLPAGSGLYAG